MRTTDNKHLNSYLAEIERSDRQGMRVQTVHLLNDMRDLFHPLSVVDLRSSAGQALGRCYSDKAASRFVR